MVRVNIPTGVGGSAEWLIKDGTEDESFMSHSYKSSEHATEADRPKLEITFNKASIVELAGKSDGGSTAGADLLALKTATERDFIIFVNRFRLFIKS